MRAPAAANASSGKDAAEPAPRSTSTSKPFCESRETMSGTSATRRSPATVSLGTPTFMPRGTLARRAAATAHVDCAGPMEHLVETYGLGLLFVLIMLESAGIPLPGETALIGAGLAASRGDLNIVWIIVVAAAAAIIGDNGGYWVARRWGREILGRWNRAQRFADRVLPPSERFFEKHGGKTVFFARFIAILRFTAAWLAGLSRMPWWRFLFWNAAGGIAWAVLVAVVAYVFGRAAADAIGRYGLLGAAAIVVVGVVALVGLKVWRNRVFEGA